MTKKPFKVAIMFLFVYYALVLILGGITFGMEDTDYTSQYDYWFDTWSEEYDIPDGLLKAISTHESGLNPDIIGCTDDLGLMQLNPRYIESHLKDMGWEWEWDWEQPRDNIMLGAYILRQNYNQLGDWTQAVSAYNTGVGGFKKHGLRLVYVYKIEWEGISY